MMLPPPLLAAGMVGFVDDIGWIRAAVVVVAALVSRMVERVGQREAYVRYGTSPPNLVRRQHRQEGELALSWPRRA